MKAVWNGFWYYAGMLSAFPFRVLFVKTKTYYEDDTKQNKRIKGKAIIIANHRSPIDGFVVAQKYYSRRIYYVVANFFKKKLRFLAPLIRVSGGVIVDRESFSFDFLEESKKLLNKEKILLLFPEGKFSYDYEPIRFVYSYIVLALETDTKIVPIVSDFQYGVFKRTRILIGNSIDLSSYGAFSGLTKENLKAINESVYRQYLSLYYLLKKKKCEHFHDTYAFNPPTPGDILRISVGTHYHYGVFLNKSEVIQFGHAINRPQEPILVNSVSMQDFCGGKIPETRVYSKKEKRCKRDIHDIIKYAHACLGQEGYNFATNNCYDLANRIVFK